MRVFVAMPHYFREISADATSKSMRAGARPERVQALAAAILGIH